MEKNFLNITPESGNGNQEVTCRETMKQLLG